MQTLLSPPRRALLLALLLLAWLPAACGYHFPGSRTQTDGRWQNSTVQIIGSGATQDPPLAFVLQERLRARLGFNGPSGSQEQSTRLKIILEPPQRALITEDRAGRGNLFQITIRAQPVAEEGAGLPRYPNVRGTATYYEPYISTSVQATQQRAKTEAMEQLADTLVALLSAPFPVTPP